MADRGWGGGMERNCEGYGVSFGGNENVLKVDSECCLQICEYAKNH